MRFAFTIYLVPTLVLLPFLVALAGDTELARQAARLPALEVEDGRVTLPVAHEAPYLWQAIHPSVKIAPNGREKKKARKLRVSYKVAASTPAGVALLFPPGTLQNLTALDVKIQSKGDVRLTFSLQDRNGVIYSFPSASVRGGDTRELTLAAAKLRHDPYQPGAPDPGSFDTGAAVLLSIVDISGFMGGAGRDMNWTLESIQGVRPKPKAGDSGGDAEESDDAASAEKATGARSAAPADAKALFLAALTRQPELREGALRALTLAYLTNPKEGITTLYLGLVHLWTAAEGDRSDPMIVEHLYLSESFLARARRLLPDDHRIPSWLVPVRMALAGIEGRDDEHAAILEPLDRAFAEDPCFHGFALALIHAPAPTDSARFRAGLESLRKLMDCDSDDPTAQNQPLWPHNIEGTLLFLADYELRAGERERARAIVDRIQAEPTYASWPYQSELDARISHLESGTAPAPSSEWVPGHSCQVCHRGP